MKQVLVVAVSVALLWFGCTFSQGQQVVATNTSVAVPPLINFGGHKCVRLKEKSQLPVPQKIFSPSLSRLAAAFRVLE